MHAFAPSGTTLDASGTRGRLRCLKGSAAIFAAIFSAACSLVSGTAQAQSVASSAQASTRTLSTPWDIKFEQIQAAMEGKFGPYYTEQIRRVRDPKTQSFEGTFEQLTYRPADAQANTLSRFKLSFRGIVGRTLSAAEFNRRSVLFGKRAGLTFSYKSFRVADAALAEREYHLHFLAKVRRSTQQGMVDVFRVVVYPKRADRTAWMLELDCRTGYPLYSGEYTLQGNGGFQMVSELVVTSYQYGVRVPSANDPGWWRPFKAITQMSSGQAAVRKALVQSKKFALPTSKHLPTGFVLEKSEVHTHPINGTNSALLAYTDGVDRLFVFQENVPYVPRGAEDVVSVLEDGGLTLCSFSHHGVSFQVVGRSVGGTVQGMSEGFYRHAINVLR